MPTIAATRLAPAEITAAAIARYGHEDGAIADILAGTPVILISVTPAGRGMGRAIQILVGPAIRFSDDGTHVYAVDPDVIYGYYLSGRRAEGDTWQAATRRATRRILADNTLPVDIERRR
ncbi:hypothetical protein ACFYUR_18855 [Micromonospora haikouensis]|uniref:hypothetical protein n=1 Tax=Micromonospora haikouensis TaxID=686309 RepID=UPI00367B5060